MPTSKKRSTLDEEPIAPQFSVLADHHPVAVGIAQHPTMGYWLVWLWEESLFWYITAYEMPEDATACALKCYAAFEATNMCRTDETIQSIDALIAKSDISPLPPPLVVRDHIVQALNQPPLTHPPLMWPKIDLHGKGKEAAQEQLIHVLASVLATIARERQQSHE